MMQRNLRVADFRKSMVFIDGTNLFRRLESHKLRMKRLYTVLNCYVTGGDIVRSYLYTIKEYYNNALSVHGEGFFDHIKVIFGEGVKKGDGNLKEKGVDALLVADMVYHAAFKNYDYALVVSNDADFAYAIKRVEDFGCRTSVLGVCDPVPDRLGEACDYVHHLGRDDMIKRGLAEPIL
jgi:uncharacterized LabA/DUF88 family protein